MNDRVELLGCSCGGSAAFVVVEGKGILFAECGTCRRSGLPVDLATLDPSTSELQAAARSWNASQSINQKGE